MTSERWQQIERLYHAALERDEGQRAAFLNETCAGDPALRREVESLLAKDTRADGFSAEPAAVAFVGLVNPDAETMSGVLEPGMTVASYRIERLLGSGGMGAVFLAYDTTLRRQVALKVIEGTAGGESSRTRLLREARNAAALNHPNICTIYEVGEANGASFIAMEYVEGRSLRDRLDEGALPVEDAVRLGIQAADALAYAHDHGVVHRDFKAANVIVAETGQLKVVDFGLARRGDALTASATTMSSAVPAGIVAGTPYAMAPEQVRGEPADVRTDLWALGVLLYELVSGTTPFSGATVPELFSSILTHAPMRLPQSVPAELRAVIERCLEKDPQRRFQHARDVRAALEMIQAGTVAPWVVWRYHLRRRPVIAAAAALLGVVGVLVGVNVGGMRDRLMGTPPSPAPIKLVVLPFENLTGDPEQEYFSDGLTDEMITQLGRLQPQRLSVIARTSAMHYKKRDIPIDQIGRDLGVDYVLEGSARREGTRVRISATLVQVRDQTQRWSDSFDRELAGILALQSDVARGVAGSLALTLLPAEQARLANARPVNPEAYEAYLKAEVHLWKLTAQEIDTAQKYFELALQKDPNYVLAQLGIGMVWAVRSNILDLPPHEGWPKAKSAALKVLELDDTVAEAHNLLGTVLFQYDWDWPAAEREFRRAIELNPNFADVHRFYSVFLRSTGPRDEGMSEIKRALELDPHSPVCQVNYGIALFYLGHDDDAIDVWQKLVRTDAEFRLTHSWLRDAFHKKGMYAQAIAEARKSLSSELSDVLARGYAEGGYQRAMHMGAEALAAQFDRRYVHPTLVAKLYAYAGEKDRALDWLERAYEERDSLLIFLPGPEWDSLRADPRLQAVLRRMNFPR